MEDKLLELLLNNAPGTVLAAVFLWLWLDLRKVHAKMRDQYNELQANYLDYVKGLLAAAKGRHQDPR